MPGGRRDDADDTTGADDRTDSGRDAADAPAAPAAPAAPTTGGPPRPMLIAAITLPIVLVIAVVVGGVIWSHQQPEPSTEPVAVGPVDAPGADSKACDLVMSALGDELDGRTRREVRGDPAGVAAWGDPAVVLRCGLPTPPELTCSSALTQVSNANGQPGVQWLQISEGGRTTYLAADRSVRIALTLPSDAGTGAIQELSSVISGVLPAREICVDGDLVPTENE